MQETIKARIFENSYISSSLLADKSFLKNLEKITQKAINTLQSNNRIFFAGNGGSTSQAQHLAAELAGRFLMDREPLDAICLSDNVSFLTAVSNDYGYDRVFERSLLAHGKKGDLIFLLSTSGASDNILFALKAANKIGIKSVAMTGLKGLDFASMSDFHITIPSEDTARIQEMHILLGHILCELIEKEIFK